MRDATPTFGKIKSSIIPNGRVVTPQRPLLTMARDQAVNDDVVKCCARWS